MTDKGRVGETEGVPFRVSILLFFLSIFPSFLIVGVSRHHGPKESERATPRNGWLGDDATTELGRADDVF